MAGGEPGGDVGEWLSGLAKSWVLLLVLWCLVPLATGATRSQIDGAVTDKDPGRPVADDLGCPAQPSACSALHPLSLVGLSLGRWLLQARVGGCTSVWGGW